MTAAVNLDGTVLLIGAGGLGCGAALGLAAAGVRRIVAVDDDRVEESNLYRQVLHAETSAGALKVDSLAQALARGWPGTIVERVPRRFDARSAADLVRACDVVVDGSDNLETKFLANDAAVLGGKLLVHAAAVEGWGQLMTVPAGGRPCYRCLFEDLPASPADAGPSCAEAGALGPVPGALGALQAVEAVRALRALRGRAGEGPAFLGRLIRYDSRLLTMRAIRVTPNPACKVCGGRPSIRSPGGAPAPSVESAP